MALDKKALFGGIGKANRGFQSNPVRESRCLVRIDGLNLFEAPKKGIMGKVTCTVLACEEGDHRVGEVVHAFYKRGDNSVRHDIWLGNVKSMLCQLLGIDKDAEEAMSAEEWADNAAVAFDEDSPLEGFVAVLTTVIKDNQAGTGKYASYGWSEQFDDDAIRDALSEDEIARFFPNLGNE